MRISQLKPTCLIIPSLVATALLMSFVFSNLRMEYLKYSLYDFWMLTFPSEKVSEDIVLVQLTDEMHEKYDHWIPLEIHQKVVDTILSHSPEHVVIHSNRDGLFFFRDDPNEIAQFMKKQNSERVSFAINDLYTKKPIRFDEIPEEFVDVPFKLLPVTQDLTSFSRDGAHRRIIVSFEGRDLLIKKLADKLGSKTLIPQIKGLWPVYETQQTRTRYAKRGSFKKFNFSEILNGKVPIDAFKNKIVLLGSATKAASADFIASPFSKSMKNYSFIFLNEAHAHDLNTLVFNQGVRFQPSRVLYLLIFISSFISLWAALICPPGKGFVFWLIMIFSFVLLTAISFAGFGVIINLAPILLAGICSYYFFLPARLVFEVKKSSREKMLMARRIGHDIKSPISALTVIASIGQGIPEKQKKLLQRATQRIESIADTLLAIENRSPVLVSSLLISELLESLIEEKKVEYAQREGLEWIFNSDSKLFCVPGNEREIKRALSNLINNSVEAIDGKGKIEVYLSYQAHRVHLEIKDNGQGLAPEELSKVGQLGHSSKKAGSGLGVHSAKKYFASLGGSVDYKSKKGCGTSVLISWPL